MAIFHLFTIFGSLIGGYILFNTLAVDNSAPQQAAGAAVAVAFVVLPYCFARSAQFIADVDKDAELLRVLKRANELMEMAVKMDKEPSPPQPPGKVPAKTPRHFSLTEN